MDTDTKASLRDDVDQDEYDAVLSLITSIDLDPEHRLPEGVIAVLKNAAWHRGADHCYVSGFIWYDRQKRFVDDYPVNTSHIVNRDRGIITTAGGAKYLAHIITAYRA